MPISKRVTRDALLRLTTGFQTVFQNALETTDTQWQQVAEVVNWNTLIETYAWLAQIPGMREWIDERYIKRLSLEGYTLTNKTYESTVAVNADAIADNLVGSYAMAIKGMAAAASNHPNELVFRALAEGFTNPCYDGQNFFDTDHGIMVDGEEVSVSNMQDGTDPAWYLLCTNRAVKPIIYQDREKPELIPHDDPKTSDHVFTKNEFLYGTKSRGVAGYSYWQLAYASKQPLTAENFGKARAAMASLKGDEGRPLGIVPNLLVVPPELETAGEEIVKTSRTASGKDNVNKGKAQLLMSTWLA